LHQVPSAVAAPYLDRCVLEVDDLGREAEAAKRLRQRCPCHALLGIEGWLGDVHEHPIGMSTRRHHLRGADVWSERYDPRVIENG
jgi:hypothetical protein